ncbi:MAG: ATP-grasp domain-containing protein [Victivallaceae bacterium]|nr:ATP-grasp domain-containing protein [Victivallaceae bacterium]
MNKKKITVAITGLNNTDNPGPGIPVIRGLLESDFFDVRIIGLAYENLEPGIYMADHVDKVYSVPYPATGTETLINRIAYINSIEKIDLLIPNFDAELYSFMKSAKALEEMGIKTFLPTLESFEERHKANLDKFGKKYGVKVPKSKAIFNLSDINKLSDDFEFPVLVKGKFYDAFVAYSNEQVTTYFNKLAAKWGVPIIIQEFIKGTEVNVIALGDGTGKTVGAVPMRKQYITDKGKAWGGITIDDQKMLKLTRSLIKKTKWRGGMEVEMIKTDDDEYYLIEINPRIPAWVYLAVGAGQNIPEALAKLALGIEFDYFTDYKVGKMFVRYSYDIVMDIDRFQQLSMTGEI